MIGGEKDVTVLIVSANPFLFNVETLLVEAELLDFYVVSTRFRARIGILGDGFDSYAAGGVG